MTPDALQGTIANPQTLNRFVYVTDNPLRFTDPTGMFLCACGASGDLSWNGGGNGLAQGHHSLTGTGNAGTQGKTNNKPPAKNKKAQQQYGRQADGSYKADPAKVQAAIKAGKPILEPGNPDHKSECVFACKALSGMKNIGTSQWRKGRAAMDLNDTTDIGLAIATLGSGTYPSQRGNSGIYMGHDANGASRLSISGRIMGHSITTRSNTL